MPDIDIDDAIATIEGDDRSSASELLERVVRILQQVRRETPGRLDEVGRRLCQAQPSMASVWWAVGLAWQRGGLASLGVEGFIPVADAAYDPVRDVIAQVGSTP